MAGLRAAAMGEQAGVNDDRGTRLGRHAALALVSAALLTLPACSLHGLALVRDDRLGIVSPVDRSTVRLPFTVRWRSDNPEAASFLVLVDRAPMPPGQTVAHYGVTNSLDGVYPRRNEPPLTSTQLTIDSLPPRGQLPPDREKQHDVTVVWLDRDGRRLTETSAFVTVTVEDFR